MQLQSGTLLQGGKYKIERVLGQGGFGITYLATQELFDRRVCIKEFFFKDYCERGAQGEVTSCTTNSKDLVDRFLNKFIKEARTISRLDHPNIVRILDIFQENGTAYYAMEYIEGCSLADKVNAQGALSEAVAVDYIKQVASALDYIHQRSINHLDVKPANIMVHQSDNKAILIDFGLSKQYDEQGGQTSTTPVGISHGYAPMEQYNAGGVSTFSPQTDIYSLGATLYKLVTGNTPPQAIEIFNEGLTGLPQSLSPNLVAAIKKTMQPKKGDRPQSIGEFTALLGGQFAAIPNSSISPSNSDESTRIIGTSNSEPIKKPSSPQPTITKVEGEKQSSVKIWLWLPVVFVIAILAIVFWPKSIDDFVVYEVPIGNHTFPKEANDSTCVEVAAVNSATHEEPIEAPKTKKAELTGKINGHEYVDLGLNVKWATCNVGASSPSDFGNYYAWGEITTKKDYSVNNYVNSTADDYIDIGSNISGTKYDAARKLWGSTWRIPTLEEIEELEKKCSWTWISQGGNNGYRIVGPSGKSIFLPAAGYRWREELERLGSGSYWSSTSYYGPGKAHCLDFSNSYFFAKGNDVDYGRPIRPVSD